MLEQNERLKMAMQEQRRQQIGGLIKRYEWKGELLVKEKEEEIARAANRNMELQNLLKRMDAENQTWQRVAKENEAMIASLNTSIQRLRESSENAAGDAESCCCQVEEERKTMCKCCNSRNSCVVILPCRHLSSCKHCEVFLDSCPLCSMPKKATIEALI
ncbi:hypothetical protein C2S52_018244 [Perilla frutescens var. hirtella]|nr:hypothetical protein C2S52_018244 [Perilla frutescens var. hirtella]